MAARKKRTAKSKTKANAKTTVVNWKKPRLKGKTFCFTGELGYERTDAGKLIEFEGGSVVSSVTKTLDYLITGYNSRSGPSGAEKKADSLNQSGKAAIQILDQCDFHTLCIPDRETAIAMLKSGRGGVKRWNSTFENYWLQATVDVTAADFRGCDMRDANLSQADLTGCDFRGAKLNGALIDAIRQARFDKATGVVQINEAHDCTFKNADFESPFDWWDGCPITAANSNFDGACIKNGLVYGLVDCTAKRADLSGAHFNPGHYSWTDLSRTDLTRAKLLRVHGYHTQALHTIFDHADLSDAEFEESQFRGASFRKANLSRTRLQNCDFSGAELSGAKFVEADMSGCNLKNANLSNANFRGAMLSDADFSGAILDGADLTDAVVVGAKLTADQIKCAKGLKLESTQSGKIGPNIRKMQNVASKSDKLDVAIRVDLEQGKYVQLHIQSWGGRWASRTDSDETLYDGKSVHESGGQHKSVSACMLGLANRWGKGTPRIGRVEVSASKSPLKKKELRLLAVAAWCEAFGMDVPTEDDLKKLAEQTADAATDRRETALADLRTGRAGVKKWNKLSNDERKSLGRLRRVDLSGLNLSKADFDGCDLQASDFTDCRLQKASFWGSDLKKAKMDRVRAKGVSFGCGKLNDASLREAEIVGAILRECSFLRTCFADSNLSGSDASGSDFRGADFTGADLSNVNFTRCKFDDKTSFPSGFKIPEEFTWAGQGKDPRLLEAIEQIPQGGPLNFESFMQRLENSFDESRLKKAIKMLKADSFQLFADIQNDSVTGVVKSQTDSNLVYSCRLDAEGTFACCTQNLNSCGGLRGALCKHLLVLIVGLTKGDELDPTSVYEWVVASRLQKPQLNKDSMSEILLKYKGAEAGEIDWRPTETVPEDYYAF